MSLAATLAASGMRPASFLPTVKCSNCGDEIEISAMGEHQCTGAPSSPNTATASAQSPFTLRPMPANETRPAQPSPLQFSADEHQTRPRAPTTGSMQKPPRPALPRINSAAANQPFLGPTTQTPLSPASSIRSGDSSRSGSRAKKPRSATNPRPPLFDPRPPSPELTGNMDCAFPPFPVAPPTPSSRKGSSASRSSRKGSSLDPRHAKDRENSMHRSSTRRSGTSDSSSRRSSKDDKSRPESKGTDRHPSQQPEFLTTVDEHPVMTPAILEPEGATSQPLSTSPEHLSPVSQPSSASPHPISAISQSSSVSSNFWSTNSQPISASSTGATTPLSPTFSTFSSGGQSFERKNSDEKGSSNGLRSISGTIRSALGRMPSKRLGGRNKNSDEQPPSIPEAPLNPLEHRPSQRKAPPQRPVRPDEGLPDDLLHPMSTRNLPPQTLYPPAPTPLQDNDRSRTLPIMSPRSLDEALAPSTITKMASEPALRTTLGSNSPPQPEIFLSQEEDTDESRMDYRMADAPPVPRPVQLHQRSDSFHKSSDSGDSTASSRSLGNLSLNNSNTTSGTSPVVSVANSIDVFRQSTYDTERNSGDDGLRVVALNVKPQLKVAIRSDPVDDEWEPPTMDIPPTVDEVESGEDSPTPPVNTPPVNKSWPLESPMDPALNGGILAPEESPSPTSPSRALSTQLAPESPKLERLSSDVYDPKRARSSKRASEQESQTAPRSITSAGSDFRGFNFGTSPSPTPPIEEADEETTMPADDLAVDNEFAGSARKDSEASTDSHIHSVPPLPPVPSEPEAAERPPLVRRDTTGKKATCRGCRKPIEGKSVKAADGRLTGRWHKACFVCQACKQPFETADFYVIDNQPYCEQHYHEKNGSICHGCRRGIEGEFLETTSGPRGTVVRKYHKRCFTCVDCRMVLSDDYFEIAGRVHCERHALAAMRSQAQRMPPGAPGGPGPRYPGSRLRAESFKSAPRRPRLAPNPA